MNKKNIPVIVQLKQNNNYIIQGINQNDAGVLFDITIMDGLEVFDFSGHSLVTVKIKRPDGTFRIDSSAGADVDTIDPTKGRIKINIPTSCTAQEGMHFCTIGFAQDEDTYFETLNFNYFVGANPNPDDESINSQDEFPVFQQMIVQMAGIVNAENQRVIAESERTENEQQRILRSANLIALIVDMLGRIDDASETAMSMMTDIQQAIAQGASVDITDIQALVTKAFLEQRLKELEFGTTADEVRDKHLLVHYGDDEIISEDEYLPTGEIALATDTGRAYIGNGGHAVPLNEPCYVPSGTEPTDTTKLWIDTSGTVPVIKYHDGDEWVSCNIAVFA